MNARRDQDSGFTLIEIMITLAVFGMGILALIAIVPLGIKRNDLASQQSRASELAAATSERLLDMPFNESDLDAGSHDDPSNPYLGHYCVKWTVEEDQPITNCKRITVEVKIPTISSPTVAKIVNVTSEAGS